MILTGKEIRQQIEEGAIRIDPFLEARVNPNSYNLALLNKLLVYRIPVVNPDPMQNLFESFLDTKEECPTDEIEIPPEGYILNPGMLYLGGTIEKVGSTHFVPVLDGRSSIGRLGMFVHITAGYLDLGFYGRITLEISVIHPLKVYPGMQCCQVRFHAVQGDRAIQYNGKYQYAEDIQASRIARELT